LRLVPKDQAFRAVRDFCKENGKVFQPEYDYRAQHGLVPQ